MIYIIVYVLFGIIFYGYGLYCLKKYKQESQTRKRILYNFFLMGLMWPIYVFKAIDTLAKTGVYKN